jgi:3,4-dihydroxy-2-butanone 4-phosphate synthase
MSSNLNLLFSQRELAKRWGRTETVIGLASAVGAGPRYVKIDGQLMYPEEEVMRYERACLFHEPAEVALQDMH